MLKEKIARVLFAVLLCCSVFSCSSKKEEVIEESVIDEQVTQPDNKEVDNKKELKIEIEDEGDIIFYSSDGYYRYGPSIMKYEDGSMDAWFSSPGNSGSQWDWISYRHSDDGIEWSEEQIVLRPTPGSKDQCSVCDPGLIYFGGYYYLGYTATDYYEGKGSYNMAFVARSQYPDGPYEKWNGSGWGGDPEPIIYYDGGKDNWGIGEVSFVIHDGDLCIYYSYIDIRDAYIGLYKADLVEDWPGTLRNKGPVLYRLDHDSVEVVYDDTLKTFLAFTIEGRMSEGSSVVLYESGDGKSFTKADSTKEFIEDYAHNLGVSKSPEGHIHSSDEQILGYAYGKDWGRWNTIFHRVMRIEEISK